MTREELLSFGERYLAGEQVAEWPAGIADIGGLWFDYRDGTRKLVRVVFRPETKLPGMVYDDFGQPDPEKTEKQRRWREMERKWDAIRFAGRKGGWRGRDTREDDATPRHERLRAAVRAYRAAHPGHGYSDIAKALQPKYRRIRDDADPRTTKRAIDALRKEIKRLETPREETPPRRRSRAESSRELPDGITWEDYPLDSYAWAIKRQRLEIEQGLARIHEGGAQGRLKARKQKRDRAARDREPLLAALKAHRRKYPDHSRRAIAEALLPTYGREVDHADPQDTEKAIRALTKRIERLEKREVRSTR